MRVIIVGAGIAGLTAADAARCAGAEVIVLEARDRIGGRTHTVSLGPGRIDLGASWVHGPIGNPVAEAFSAAGTRTLNDGAFGAPMEVWADGWIDAAGATTVASVLQADWDAAEALAADPGSDRFVDGVEWYLADRGLDGRARDLARFALLWIAGALVVAGPPEGISLAGMAAYEEWSGGNLVPAGGYRDLADLLVPGLDVRLGTTVAHVAHAGEGVSVVADDGNRIEGDRAIVTVPLGVLRAGHITFDPPLHDAQAGAIERLVMGTLEKVAFRFGERFWPDSLWEITRIAADKSFPAWFDFTRHVGAPSLVALYNPQSTPRLAAMDLEERAAEALAALREMFGSVPDPEETLATDWAGEAFSLGSYSYVPLGASVDDMRRLGEPASPRLTLAGEVTVPHCYGTVEAAFVSGLRAAAQTLGEEPRELTLGPVPSQWLGGPYSETPGVQGAAGDPLRH
jgi:monoamine oxidase